MHVTIQISEHAGGWMMVTNYAAIVSNYRTIQQWNAQRIEKNLNPKDMEKQELLQRVNNYVTHARKVHESTKDVYRHKLEYALTTEKLQFCKTSLADLTLQNSKYQIARRVYSLRRELKDILPNLVNDSYQSSLTEYEIILAECQETIQNETVQ